MSSDSKAHEKAYLSRSGSLAWERIKPFSPPATDTLAESTRLMHDFAVALNALDAAANHRILDLGAGACWTSEWLHRLNLRVASIDIARDMLLVGRERAGTNPWPLVTGDLEALPFKTGSFDRALCMNALHHMPHPDRALSDIVRVLTPGGRLVLVEPGRGHAGNPTSVKAVEAFGVLERELEASELMRLCSAAGFSTVNLLPLSYATDEIALTIDQIERWRTWTRTKRPHRALQKLRLAILEFFGRAKADELFEDALAMWFSRVLVRHVGEQGIVVASKAGYAPSAGEFRAEITAHGENSGEWGDEGSWRCGIRAHNAGTATWRARGGIGTVRVGITLLDDAHGPVPVQLDRLSLPSDVLPGQSVELVIEVPFEAAKGARHAKIDLVAEHVAWFEDRGSTPLVLDIPVARP